MKYLIIKNNVNRYCVVDTEKLLHSEYADDLSDVVKASRVSHSYYLREGRQGNIAKALQKITSDGYDIVIEVNSLVNFEETYPELLL